jgi:hypothetical protein
MTFILESLHMAIRATEADAKRLEILLESFKQPVAGSETADQENKLHVVTLRLCVRNKTLTLTGVEATRVCCSNALIIAWTDGSNKPATSWLKVT